MAVSRTYIYDTTVTFSIWAKKNGTWTKVQTYTRSQNLGSSGTGGSKTFAMSVADTFQLGSGVQAFGVTIDSVVSGTAALTSFPTASWQAQGTSGGSSSATPNNQTSNVTVRPV
jgi:hypothetical protein